MSNAEREGSQTEPHDRPALSDLEMTKLCAEALGMPYITPSDDYDGRAGIMICDEHGNARYTFHPLRDEGNAMRLVKQLGISINYLRGSQCWIAIRAHGYYEENYDLNRAIVECVARMQDESVGTKPDAGTALKEQTDK